MSPVIFLGIVVAITVASWLVESVRRHGRRAQFVKLAAEFNMAYSPEDRFSLSDRVADHFPVTGAAAVRVVDLLYASEPGGYRYLFSAEYTIGVIRSKRRAVRAATFFESRNVPEADAWSTLQLAPEELPLMEQYRKLATEFHPPFHPPVVM